MAQSTQHATLGTKEALNALSDLAFAELLARRLASLASENEAAKSRLGILSCLAAEALKEDFPESVAEETPVSDSESLYDETEDSSGVEDPNEHNCPRFKASRLRATGSARIANDFVVRAVRE